MHKQANCTGHQNAGELNLDGYFATVTGSDSLPYQKPDPRHLIETIELAGGSRHCATMIADTETDIRTAQNATIPIIAVNFGFSEHHVSSYGPDAVISHYDQVFQKAQKLIRRN